MTRRGSRFDVWAPRPRAASRLVGRRRRRRRRRRCAAAPTAGGRPPSARRDRDGPTSTTATCSTTTSTPCPDPRSRRQPDGVHELSRTFDPASFALDRRGLDRAAAAGLGRLRAARRHLHARGHARRARSASSTTCARSASTSSSCCRSTPSTARTTGATTGCSGSPSHEEYGGPAAYQRFVDACHAAGLGVIQDVVYNHLGP